VGDSGSLRPKSVISRLKAVLPQGPKFRRLPVGIGRGLCVEIDFSYQTRAFLGLYEIELNRHLRLLCPPGTDSFDVGGQYGYDALVLAKLSGGRVLTFESDKECCLSIGRSVAANPGLHGSVQVQHAFVTAVSDAGNGKVALDDVAFGADGFVPDFMKIDIEGEEVQALLGATRILAERAPNLLVETHSLSLERECQAILASFGYRWEVVDQRKWLRDFRPAEHNRWLVARFDDAAPGDRRRRRSSPSA